MSFSARTAALADNLRYAAGWPNWSMASIGHES